MNLLALSAFEHVRNFGVGLVGCGALAVSCPSANVQNPIGLTVQTFEYIRNHDIISSRLVDFQGAVVKAPHYLSNTLAPENFRAWQRQSTKVRSTRKYLWCLCDYMFVV
jgi:hypothetical protein